MASPKVNVIISDTHCGSDVGLMPALWENGKGNQLTHGNNFHQQWLWENFISCQQRVYDYLGKEPFILTFNGDAIEGIHHRTTEIVSSKWEEHLDIAIKCLKPLADKSHATLVVKGTECHTLNLENELNRQLGGEGAKDKWLYKINGCLVDAAHHIGTTSRAHLESSAYSINIANASRQAERAGHEVPRVFLRGHRHVGGYFSDGYSMMGITGAWQFLTRHGHKVVPDSIPSPTIMVLDWRWSEEGGLPTVVEFRATPPQETITNI